MPGEPGGVEKSERDQPVDAQPVAVVTGAGGGLGCALVGALEAAGYRVAGAERGTLDVTDAAAVKEFFDGLPALDLLVNNAGVREDALVGNLTEEAWDRVMEVNLRGAFLCARAAARRLMRQRRGHIVNVGSFSAKSGPAGQAAYAAAKAGLIGLGQSLARELGPFGVRVNTVLPGWLETKFTRDVPPAVVEKALAAHALGRFNTAGDAARFIVFLDSMAHVSGQVFQLDSRVGRWA